MSRASENVTSSGTILDVDKKFLEENSDKYIPRKRKTLNSKYFLKEDMIRLIAYRTGFTFTDVKEIIDCFYFSIPEIMSKCYKITIGPVSFGCEYIKESRVFKNNLGKYKRRNYIRPYCYLSENYKNSLRKTGETETIEKY